MRERTRTILTGGLMGLLVAGALATPSFLPPAMADEEPARTLLKTGAELFPKQIEGSDFVKPEWTVEPWVSMDVIEEVTVRKIGYGKTEFVSIMTTATGTYSSDGLASPHIRYPGIHANDTTAAFDAVAYWEGGWQLIKPLTAGSFISAVPFKGGKLIMTEDGSCLKLRGDLYC